ncbi:MAG: ATP-dependent dethiobiotin synthetase BioD, partial [Alphaproteobacteria bacterium]
ALGCPFLLVAGNYLGTLSHSIATVEALAARGLRPRAIILSDRGDGPVAVAETASALTTRLRLPVHILPTLEGTAPWQRAPNLLAPLGMI